MKKMASCLLLIVSLFSVSSLSAYDYDYDFHQERMIINRGEIYLLSTFDTIDGVTVYNFNGQRLWEVKFNSKIISWDVQPNLIFVFSKDRNGNSTYITCLDRITGRILWERP